MSFPQAVTVNKKTITSSYTGETLTIGGGGSPNPNPAFIYVGPTELTASYPSVSNANSFFFNISPPSGVSGQELTDLITADLMNLRIWVNDPQDQYNNDSNGWMGVIASNSANTSDFKIFNGDPSGHRYGFSNFTIVAASSPYAAGSYNVTFDLTCWTESEYPDPTHGFGSGYPTETEEQIISRVPPPVGTLHSISLALEFGGGKYVATIADKIEVGRPSLHFHNWRTLQYTGSAWSALAYGPTTSYADPTFNMGALYGPGTPGENPNNLLLQLVDKYIYKVGTEFSFTNYVRGLNSMLEWSIDGGTTWLGMVPDTYAISAVEQTTGNYRVSISGSPTLTAIKQIPATTRAVTLKVTTGAGDYGTPVLWAVSPTCNYRGVAYNNGGATLSTLTASTTNTLNIDPNLFQIGTHYVEILLKENAYNNPVIGRAIYRIIVCSAATTDETLAIDGQMQPLSLAALMNNGAGSFKAATGANGPYVVNLKKWGFGAAPIDVGTLKIWVSKNPTFTYSPAEPYPTYYVRDATSFWVDPSTPHTLEDIITIQFTPTTNPANVWIRSVSKEIESSSAVYKFSSLGSCSTWGSTSSLVSTFVSASSPVAVTLTDNTDKIVYFQAINGTSGNSQNIPVLSSALFPNCSFSWGYANNVGGTLSSPSTWNTIALDGTGPVTIVPPSGFGPTDLWYYAIKFTPGGSNLTGSYQSFSVGCGSGTVPIQITDSRTVTGPNIYWNPSNLQNDTIGYDPATSTPPGYIAYFDFSCSNITPSGHKLKLTLTKPGGSPVDWKDPAETCGCGLCIPTLTFDGVTATSTLVGGFNLITLPTASDYGRITFKTCLTPAPTDSYVFTGRIVDNSGNPITGSAAQPFTFVLTYNATPVNITTIQPRSDYNGHNEGSGAFSTWVVSTNPRTGTMFGSIPASYQKAVSNVAILQLIKNSVQQNPAPYTLDISSDSVNYVTYANRGNVGLADVTVSLSGSDILVRAPYTVHYTNPVDGIRRNKFWLRYTNGSDITPPMKVRISPMITFWELYATNHIEGALSTGSGTNFNYALLLSAFVQGVPLDVATFDLTNPEWKGIGLSWPSNFKHYNNDTTGPFIAYGRFFPESSINVLKFIGRGDTVGDGDIIASYTDPDDSSVLKLYQQTVTVSSSDVTNPLLTVNSYNHADFVDYNTTQLTFAFGGTPNVAQTADVVYFDSNGVAQLLTWAPTSVVSGTLSGNCVVQTTLANMATKDLYGNAKAIPPTVNRLWIFSNASHSEYYGFYDPTAFSSSGSSTILNNPDLIDYFYSRKNSATVLSVGACTSTLAGTIEPPSGSALNPIIKSKTYTQTSIKVKDGNGVVIPNATFKITSASTTAATDVAGWATVTNLAQLGSALSHYNINATQVGLSGQIDLQGFTPVPTPLPNGPEVITLNFQVADNSHACATFTLTIPVIDKPAATLTITPSTVNNVALCDLYAVNATPFSVALPNTTVITSFSGTDYFKIVGVEYLQQPAASGQSYQSWPGNAVQNFCYDSGLDLRSTTQAGYFAFSTQGTLPIAGGLGTRKQGNGVDPLLPAGSTTPFRVYLEAQYTDGATVRMGYLTLNFNVTRNAASTANAASTDATSASLPTLLTPVISGHANSTGRTCVSPPTNIQVCGYNGEGAKLTFSFDPRVNLSDYKLYGVKGLSTASPTVVQASTSEVNYDLVSKIVTFTPTAGGLLTSSISPVSGGPGYTDIALVLRVPKTTIGNTAGAYGHDDSCFYGYFPTGGVLQPNYRYLGAKTSVTVNDATLYMEYPTSAPGIDLPVTHSVSQGLSSITGVTWERLLSDGVTYTTVSPVLTPTPVGTTQIKYTIPSVIFDPTTVTTTAPTVTQQYRITFISASGNTTAKLFIQPLGIRVTLSPNVCSTAAPVGALYQQVYAINCNVCAPAALKSTIWKLPSGLVDNSLFTLEYPGGSDHSTVRVKSNNVITSTSYTYNLVGSIDLPSGAKQDVSLTCTFIGSTAFDITNNLAPTTVGANYGQTMTAINATCTSGSPSVVWSMGPSANGKFPTGLGLSLTPTGQLSWLPVPFDPSLTATPKYPAVYTINFVAKLLCSGTVVATVSKDLDLQVGASQIQLISMTPNQGFYDTGNTVDFVGANFDPAVTVFFDAMPGTVLFLNSGSLQVTTPVVPQPDAAIELATRVHMYNPDGGTLLHTQEPIYTFVPQLSPVLNSVTPSSGTPFGWTKVTIKGRNFEPFSRVYMSQGLYSNPTTDVLLPILSITPDSIVFLTQPHVAGTAQIRVTNRALPDGVIAYTFKDGPTITDIVPSIISSLGDTTTVYITGANFYGSTTGSKPRVFVDDFEIPSANITIVQS